MHCKNALSLARVVPFVLAAACTDTAKTTAPIISTSPVVTAEQGPRLAALTCAASIQHRTVSCTSPDAGTSGAARNVIIGGQNQFITLTSSNIEVVDTLFSFDVTVTNLIPQSIGTTNGTTADPAGVRVFFSAGPTATSGGTISVANPDGEGTFTGSTQPYFQYSGLLPQSATSAAKPWKLRITPEVTSFTFTVYVSAEVQYPNGYVDGLPYVLALNPNETRTLTGTVRSFVGNPLAGETVTWATNSPGTAALTGAQVTAGSSRGVATLTAADGARPGVFTTAVSVCEATPVSNGSNIPASIASSDCFSSFGDPNGRPTSTYYADLYRVTLTAGQTVTVTMDTGDDLDSYLLLADGAFGYLVAGNDDDDDGVLGVGSRLVYTATTSGTYVIEASTFNGLDTGNYTLHVTIE